MDNKYFEKSLPELEPVIREAIRDGGQFVFYPSGISMLPAIEGKRDCVVLVSPLDLHKYDLIFYKRANGQYVLHRIMNIKNGQYTLCGDNQIYYEYNITSSMIIAKVSEIRKADGSIIVGGSLHSGMVKLHIKRFVKKTCGKIKRAIKGE